MNDGVIPRRWVAAAGCLAIACALVLSRALLAPKLLYYFDSVNFALALDEFNPARHQPQPPGYPLFVLLARMVHSVVPDVQATFVICGILGSALALALLWRAGRDMFGGRAAICAVLLMLFNGPFWFGALTNQVRVFLAVAGAALVFTVFRSLKETGSRWFFISAVVFAVSAGFRPALVLFAAPLIAFAAVARRRSVTQIATAAGIIIVAASPWVVAVLIASGGPLEFVRLLRDYSTQQFAGSSAAFGAETKSALRMLVMAVIWYGVPVLTWIFVVPFSRGAVGELRGTAGVVLAHCFIPAFLFHAFIHVGDPDHTAFAVPAVCAVGGLLLSRATRPALFTAVAVALNLLVFFAPPRGIARACSYRAVRDTGRMNAETIEAIRELRKAGPIVLVFYDHPVTWRYLTYYFPEIPLLYLREDPRKEGAAASAWLLANRKMTPPDTSANGEIVLPHGRTVWLLSNGRGMHALLAQSVRLTRVSRVALAEAPPGAPIQFGTYRIVTAQPRVGVAPDPGIPAPALPVQAPSALEPSAQQAPAPLALAR